MVCASCRNRPPAPGAVCRWRTQQPRASLRTPASATQRERCGCVRRGRARLRPEGGQPEVCQLDGDHLESSQLDGGQLESGQLDGGQLGGQLEGVQLEGVQLEGVQLEGVQLEGGLDGGRTCSGVGPARHGRVWARPHTSIHCYT
eukprot:360103-Chlamydomonas_euryale.AAC.10